MVGLCVTRSLKVRKYLRAKVPTTIPRSSLEALEKMSPQVLATLHSRSDMGHVIHDPKLRKWLADNPVPAPKASVANELFRGTLVFVQMTFNRPMQPAFSVLPADVQTALNYASLAIGPIQRYASQYGPNSLQVSSNILNFTADLQGNTFSDDDLQGWVDRIVSDNSLTNSCVIILHDAVQANAPTNTEAGTGVGGYHSATGNGHPYCFCKVFAQNLTIKDVNNRKDETVWSAAWSDVSGWSVWFSLGGPPGGFAVGTSVAAVAREAERLDLWAVAKEGNVWSAAWSDAAGWSGWFSLAAPPGGLPATARVTAVARKPGQLDIFAIAKDGSAWSAAWSDVSGWSVWFSLGGPPGGFAVGTSVAAVAREAERLDLWAVAKDGNIWSAAWSDAAGWSVWFSLEAPDDGFPASATVAAVARKPGQLDVWSVSKGGNIWSIAWSEASGWGVWFVL